MKPLTSSDKRRIIEKLNEQFGIQELPYLIIQFGKEKLRLYSGAFSKEELYNLDRNARVENIGLYFAKFEDDGIRLTIDGVQLLKNQITKNILEIDDKNAENWMRGNDLDIREKRAWVVLRHGDEFLGCGKSTGEKISNFVPNERRIK
jgi:NOL1/NOP2/fmu family ribosome biogenesis protein